MHVSFGDVGMLFVPGEVPSELVVGLPSDFNTAPDTKYYHDAANDHAVGDKYVIPGNYLSLVDEPLLSSSDWVRTNWAISSRLRITVCSVTHSHCPRVPGASCADLAARGVIESPTWVGGLTCQRAFDNPAFLASLRRGRASGQGDLPLRAIRGFCRSRSRPGTMKKPMPPDGTWWTICGRPP